MTVFLLTMETKELMAKIIPNQNELTEYVQAIVLL